VRSALRAFGLAALALVLAGASPATDGRDRPAERDRCPVCGMFVARYPEWIAEVTFADGGHAFFDGPKDLFKFLPDPGRWVRGRTPAEVRTIVVTDYYAVEPVDARAAFYVEGSEVMGPMGRELVPFRSEADAREFLHDHRGTRILRFGEITPGVVLALDEAS
jgi:nitrous oxide reductase accessory protein NosL